MELLDEKAKLRYTKLRSEIMKIRQALRYFSIFEWLLWGFSALAVIFSYVLGGENYPLPLIASLLGVTALIFIAKGNVAGQFITVVFACLYAVVSIRYRYWGEMITYLFMSLPAALFSCVSWLKHPSKESKAEVEVSSLTKKTLALSLLFSLLATILFYFILRYFHTPNLLLSTLSITTSFLASAFLFLRSRFYALAYAANDIVLIGLWVLASFDNIGNQPMAVCFLAFLLSDLYGFFNWKRIQIKQKKQE